MMLHLRQKYLSCSAFGNKEQCRQRSVSAGGKDLAAVYKKSSVGSTQSSEIGYVIKDHLVNETRLLQACAAKAVGRINPFGSSVWALANETGGFVEKYAYDPWGRRMLPDNWNKRDSLRTTFFTDCGFTLHEHYDKLQIINMNARMYDPILGEFTSVDPLADKYPGWGPYVYCVNNPVKYWDPKGENTYDENGNMIDNNGGVNQNYLKTADDNIHRLYIDYRVVQR